MDVSGVEKLVKGKEVNAMGEFVEGLMAVVGCMAGLMVALTTLVDSSIPSAKRRDEPDHAPHTIRPLGERMAA